MTPGTTYNLRIIAVDAAGDGEPSTVITFATLPDPQAQQAEPEPNSPATGRPGIGGAPSVGSTLAADLSAISDADGLDNAAYGYQWLAGDTEIAGATGATYTVASGDEGKAIKVRVGFTDDARQRGISDQRGHGTGDGAGAARRCGNGGRRDSDPDLQRVP